MNIQECFDFLNFWINKKTNSWFTIAELTAIVDRGSLSLYSDLQPKYATSQHIKDALAPFKVTENFTTLVSGNVVVAGTDYLNLLDIQIYYTVSDRRIYSPVQLVNEDERAQRLNSQIDPVTATSPIGEQVGIKTFRLYPAAAYSGNVTYLRRPVKPVFGYTLISERVVVYDAGTSTQLEWSEEWQNAVLLKALSSIGINLSSAEVSQYAEIKSQQNWQNQNRV